MSDHWISEKVFHDGDSFFLQLESEIKSAKHRIDLETYIFESDEFGLYISELLIQAAQRGVVVRIIVDGFGSPRWKTDFLPQFISAGVLAKIYHPLPWNVSFLSIVKLFSTLNRRDHRKIWIIDRNVAWISSMNISANHLKKFKKSEAWRDTGVRIEGIQIQSIRKAFHKTWLRSWSPKKRKRWWRFQALRMRQVPQTLVRLNSNFRLRKQMYRDLLFKIINAQFRVWITNAYFVPDGSLIKALRMAAQKGVDVRILVPQKPDVHFIHSVSSALYYALLKTDAKIYEYLPRPIHAKTILIDRWVSVGTSNLNYRSLLHDLEVDIVLTKEESIESLEEQFRIDLKQSKKISMLDWKHRALKDRILGRILFLLRYWL